MRGWPPAWFRQVETPADAWELHWEASRKNGCPGVCQRDPTIRVWAKPRRHEPHVPACEKIAADLGLMLGLPVAPVLLTRIRQGGSVKGLALSGYAPAPAHRAWSRVKQRGPGWLVRAVKRWFDDHRHLLAGIWVLDTWLRNQDRTDRNVMVAYGPGRLRAVYFYDFDLSQEWLAGVRGADRRPVQVVRTTADVRARSDYRAVRAWIRRVQSLPASRIRQVIWRLPEPFMTESQKRLALRTLLRRRRQLLRAFRSAFEGGSRIGPHRVEGANS